MLPPVSATLNGKSGPIPVVFGEASPEQQIRCFRLGSAAFGSPLSEAAYLEREEYLGQRPLTRNKGWRVWCISLAEDPSQILATCKTMHRDLLVRDAHGTREQQAYCISSVVADPRHRGLGSASALLKYVAEWMDGPGNAVASMLYTVVGDFYVSRGWKLTPAFQSTLSWPLGYSIPRDAAHPSGTRFLTSEDIPGLCARDVEGFKDSLESQTAAPDEVHVAILPTANIITWQHDRASFISLKVCGRKPESYGSICESADTWIYWYHDFKGQALAIQRARIPAEQTQIHEEALASLLLDAVEEARKWDLQKVIIWDPNPCLLRAMNILPDQSGIVVKTEERDGKMNIPSVRWRGSDETKNITVHMNEFYAWS